MILLKAWIDICICLWFSLFRVGDSNPTRVQRWCRDIGEDDDVVMVAIGEASMLWETRGGVFNATRAEAIGKALRQHYADGIGDFATARRRVCDDMRRDEDLRDVYRCNIACRIMDGSELNAGTCNAIADRIMEAIFEVTNDSKIKSYSTPL